MFKRVGINGGTLSFEDISPQLTKLPSWMESQSGSVNDAQVLSLRPPRIPLGLDAVGGEPEPFMEAGSAKDESPPDESEPPAGAEDELASEASSQVPSSAAVPNRRDTLVEEIVPRAEEEAIAAIRGAVQELVDQRRAVLQDAEAQLVQLVRVISKRVIARELHIDPSVISAMVQEGLGALSANDAVTIRIGAFFSVVAAQLETELARTGVIAKVLVDPAVGMYGCRIQTGWGSVDESVETRLRTLLEGISIAPPPAP